MSGAVTTEAARSTVLPPATDQLNTMQPPSQASLAVLSKPSSKAWFATEIQHMMFGFGDCRKPLVESATLIEEIVHRQMTQLLYQAEEVAKLRNARFIGIEDFLFLLRKQKIKLARLIKYLEFKDNKSLVFKSSSLDEEETSEQGETKVIKKRKKICLDFLSTIDQTGELLALFDGDPMDEIKLERAMRADLLSRQMDPAQYREYSAAKQSSFTPRYKIQKFRDWVLAGINLDVKPNPLAVEVVSYMAYETVAQIVDLSLLVKRDQNAIVEDPFVQAIPPACCNYDMISGLNSPPQQQTAKSPSSSRTTSPTTSPPLTPTGLSPLGIGGTPGTPGQSVSTGTPSSGGSTKSSKNKKKKKGSSQFSRDIHSNDAIQTYDIREAMRRYSQSIGPFADFSKTPCLNPQQNLLCI